MVRTIWSWIKEVFGDFFADGAMGLAASIAFYTIFSLAPLLIIVIAVAGAVWGAEAAQNEIVGQFRGLVGQQGGEAIQGIIQNASQQGTGTLAAIIGIATLILGATGVFGELKAALNRIWEVQAKPKNAILGWLRERLLSFTMVLCIAFLLLVSLTVSAGLSAAGEWMGSRLPLPAWLMQGLNIVISLAALTLLFAAIFKVLPDVKIAWREVWIGAAVTALLFTGGKFLIGLYLGKASTASVYGAAGSVVLILLWVYYSSLILLLGAEFTQVHARRTGAKIMPSRYAIPLSQAEVEDDRPRSAVEKSAGRASKKRANLGSPANKR